MKRSPIKRRQKYGNQRTYSMLCKRHFDSAAEARYADHLFARQENGEIRGLEFQVKVHFSVQGVDLGITHRVDFRYIELTNIPLWVGDPPLLVHDEYKGKKTSDWVLKKKLYAAGAGEGVVALKVTTVNRSSKMVPYDTEWCVPRGD